MPKTSIISEKEYICSLCNRLRTGNCDLEKDIVCWSCVNKLLNTPKEKIQSLYDKFIEKGWLDKAKLIEGWLSEKEIEYEKFRRTVVGRRTFKQTTPTKSKRKVRKNR